MPTRPPHPCNKAGCGRLVTTRYCEEHQKQAEDQQRQRLKQTLARYEHERLTSKQRGYTHRWAMARKQYLALNPLCRPCQEQGRLTAANVVDHIIPHRGDMAKFWDYENWQPICTPCHGAKTLREMRGRH